MITIEQRTSLSRGRKTSAIWKVPPEKREKWGTCISYLRLNECKKMANGKQEITFSRSKQISHVEISRGDFIIVSSKRCYAIITGSIVSINENSIVLISDHELLDEAQQNEFHLDRLESTSTHAINLSSVGFLMSDDLKRERLRNLVIDLIEPQFEKIPKSLIQKISPLISSLNKEQARAVVRALVAKDYALIEGLPGAGKSTTLSCIVRCFLELGQSVLITSYTHSAVDNLFEKFMEYVPEKDLLRIGNRYSVKDKVAHLTIDSKMENISDGRFDAMKGLLNNARVVGATCLSVSSHPMFSFRTFDVCLVDEASLALECSLLTPLSICQKFILVGDARQLAPLVQSREARDMGMNRSLFERLQKHRLALSSLNLQYRMNQKIAAISSTLFYSGKLLCINETLAKSTIQLLSTDLITNRLYSSEIDDAIVFVNTDSKSLQEAQMLSQSGSVVTNVFEAVKIDCICKKFVELGISPGDIGVICTYRKQVELVRQRISWNEIEVNTIDQYQGRDKSIIIWSLVWTDNNSGSTCELLNDERRVNVAVTRAKHKLILVGCLSSMHHVSPIMRRLIDLLAPSEILTVDSI